MTFETNKQYIHLRVLQSKKRQLLFCFSDYISISIYLSCKIQMDVRQDDQQSAKKKKEKLDKSEKRLIKWENCNSFETKNSDIQIIFVK